MSVLALILIATPVPATLNDVVASREGERLTVIVELDGQPGSASATPGLDGVQVSLGGVTLQPQAIRPSGDGSPVNRVLVTPTSDGTRLVIETGATPRDVRATLFRNAVRIEAVVGPPPPPPGPPPPDATQCLAADAALARDAWALDAIVTRGRCFVVAGKPEEARAAFNRVLSFDPDHAGAKEALASLPAPAAPTVPPANVAPAAIPPARAPDRNAAAASTSAPVSLVPPPRTPS
jgi:hypothetical protein